MLFLILQAATRHTAALGEAKSTFASRILALDHCARKQLQMVVDASNDNCATFSVATTRRLQLLSATVERSVKALRAQGEQLVEIRASLQSKLQDSRDECSRLENLLDSAQQAGSGTNAHLQAKAAELQKTILALDASKLRCTELEGSVASLDFMLKVY
jgi:hypothetical protein